MAPLGAYAVVAAVSAVVTFALVFPIRRLATRFGFVVEPDERRVHQRTTPLGGGVAMFLAFLLAMAVAAGMPSLRPVFAGSSEPLGLVLGAAVIFAVGTIDDYRDMSAPAKVAGQVLAAMVLVYMGVTMFQFKIPFVGFLVLSSQMTPLLTALWVVVITNAVNLIDGLDGLAAGVVAIAAGALAVYGLRLVDLGVLPSDNIGPLIAVITCGVCLGFLPHNFHVAKAFMGDGGALFLGLLMAAATMVIGGRTPEYSGQSYFFFAPLFIPLFILGVPIADMAFAFVRRTARGLNFAHADKDHLHHRLLRLGHGPRRTVVILWAWTAVLSGFVLYPLFGGSGNSVIPFLVVAAGLALYTLFHPDLRRTAITGEDRQRSQVAAAAATAADAADSGTPDGGSPGGDTEFVHDTGAVSDDAGTVADGHRGERRGAEQVGAGIVHLAASAGPGSDDGRLRHPSRVSSVVPGADGAVRRRPFIAVGHSSNRRLVARYRDGDEPLRPARGDEDGGGWPGPGKRRPWT